MNLGDISLGQVLYFHFTTRQFSTGTPITSALLAVSVYKDDSTTESTTGITTTFSSGFDGVAGLVSVKIDTSTDGTFYASGHDFSVVVTGGTADGVSIIGEVVGYFSIQNRSALRPTTSGRTLVVDANGLADANVVNVAGTAQTAGDIISDTTAIKAKTNNLPASPASTTNITAGTITTVTNLTNAPTAGDFTADMKTSLNAATPSVTVSDKTEFSLVAAYDPAKTAAQAGDAMTLTAGERISIGTAVWVSATRTLTSFGTLIADIWASVSRTLTDKTDFSLTAAYDPAKTAAQAGDVMKVDSGTGANQIDITNGKVNVGKINSADVIGTGQAADLWRG